MARSRPRLRLSGPCRSELFNHKVRGFFLKIPQNRHPERSAPQLYPVTERVRWRGVEGPRLRLSTPCRLELFHHKVRVFFCISNSPQNRHPERSASQLYPVWQREFGGARTSAVLIYRMPLGAFKAREQDVLRYALDGHGCVFSPLGASSFSLLGTRERPRRISPVPASVVEKLGAAWSR